MVEDDKNTLDTVRTDRESGEQCMERARVGLEGGWLCRDGDTVSRKVGRVMDWGMRMDL